MKGKEGDRVAPEFQQAGDPVTRQLITLEWFSPNLLKSVKTQEVSSMEKESKTDPGW